MGLDCSHDAFSGGYGRFNRFRQLVCSAAGGKFPPHDDPQLDNGLIYYSDDFTGTSHPGFHEFMSHSDCEGDISPEMCAMVANDLEELLPKIKEIDENGFKWTSQFIKGCREAHALNEPLEFY